MPAVEFNCPSTGTGEAESEEPLKYDINFQVSTGFGEIMATDSDRSMQALCDVTGIITDRTVEPELLVGQAWIISKSRMVVPASTVANYVDAPWALLVRFPYPDLTFSIKAITLHPDFNKRAARDFYLSRANELQPQPPFFENDIATLTIDAEIPEIPPDKVQELNRALSLPLVISAQDLSGVMHPGETGNILQKALSSGRNGVLSFYDERKVPFARLLLSSGKILKAVYGNLQNEFAVCELMWRKPGGNFLLQYNDSLSWASIPDMSMPTDHLSSESRRRTLELPKIIDALGGAEVRYARSRPSLDSAQLNQQTRWFIEKLWPGLDGSLPLSVIPERFGVDSYTAAQAILELKQKGLIAQQTGDRFHRSGKLGAPLTPGHDIDLKFWDSLQAFYIDEQSSLPVSAQGNYFGSNRLLNLSTLLHTVSLPGCKSGAVVLREGRLIGIHNGKFTSNLASPPPMQLGQMIWIGALSELSAKRMRNTASEIDMEAAEESAAASGGRSTVSGIKTRAQVQLPPELIEQPREEESVQKPEPVNEPEILRKFSKVQILGAGGSMFIIGVLMALSSLLSPKPAAISVADTAGQNATGSQTSVSQTPAATETSTSADGSATTDNAAEVKKAEPLAPASIKEALRLACFKDKAFPTFGFIDTIKQTGNKPSFSLESEKSNLKILICVWPNPDLRSTLEITTKTPPFTTLKTAEIGVVEEGSSPLRDFIWRAKRYVTPDEKPATALVGAYSSADPNKSILVVATPYSGEGELDYRCAVNMVQRMLTEPGSENSQQTAQEKTEASPEEIKAYINKTGESIKAAFKAPSDADRANKCTINFTLDSSGKISKLELKYSSGVDDLDKAVQKAIQTNAPYAAPPRTKSGQLGIQVNFVDGALSFNEF